MVLIFWSCEAPSNLGEGSVSGSSMVELPLLAAAPVAFTRHLQARFTLGVDPRRGWEVVDAITGVATVLWGLTQCCPDCRHPPACSPAPFQRALSVQKAAASTQPASPKALLVPFLWGRDIVCVLHCLSASELTFSQGDQLQTWPCSSNKLVTCREMCLKGAHGCRDVEWGGPRWEQRSLGRSWEAEEEEPAPQKGAYASPEGARLVGRQRQVSRELIGVHH